MTEGELVGRSAWFEVWTSGAVSGMQCILASGIEEDPLYRQALRYRLGVTRRSRFLQPDRHQERLPRAARVRREWDHPAISEPTT